MAVRSSRWAVILTILNLSCVEMVTDPGTAKPAPLTTISNVFELTFPFPDREISAELELRNWKGEKQTAIVEATLTLDRQSDGDIDGDVELRIPASIDSGQVLVTIEYLGDSDVVVQTRVAGPYFSSADWPRKNSHYIFELQSQVADARSVRVVLESVDYSLGDPKSAPGPIDASINSVPTTHIFILPGILGDSFQIRQVKQYLESSTDADGNPIEVRTWDWTRKWESQQQSIQDRLYITEETCRIGQDFASELIEWRNASKNVHAVHLIGMSAGSMIAKATCGAIDAGTPMLPDNFFGKIMFLSGALDIRESWESLDRCSEQVFNYYSYGDQIVATRFPSFLIFRIRIAVAWPACGGVGLKKGSDAEAVHVSYQLPWIRRENDGRGEDLGNAGTHLDPGCLAEQYFSTYILPIFTKPQAEWPLRSDKLIDGWHPDVHPEYNQDATGWGLPDRLEERCP